jgi:uncharacterized protein
MSRALHVILILLLFASAVGAQDLPKPQGYVNDFASVIDATDENAIRSAIEEVQQKTGAEIAVVTVDSFAPYATIEDFGIALAEEWQVGPADTDEGVILIVAVEERRVRIEVGYGLEGAITDSRAGRILDDYVVPYLRNNEWGAGLLNGVRAIAERIASEHGVTLTGTAPEAPSSESDGLDPFNLIYLVIVIIAIASRRFFLPLLFMGRRRGFYGGGFGSTGRSGGGFSGFSGGGFGGGGASRGF